MRIFKHLLAFSFLVVLAYSSCRKNPNCEDDMGGYYRTFYLPPFKNVTVNEHMVLKIREGNEYKMKIHVKTNILHSHFGFRVTSENLILLFSTGHCPFRDSTQAVQVELTVPDLKSIRNSSEYAVYCDDTLHFPELTLISENYSEPRSPATGDFYLKINNRRLTIVSNNLSRFLIQGKTEYLNVNFYAGLSRFEGKNLRADIIRVLHNSANDMEVFPVNEIHGDLYSTGNLLIYNTPPVIDVTEHYRGKVIFK
jgi:hypothetical protein